MTHDFPRIGKDIGAVPVLKELIKNGHQLILFTMRSDIENPKQTSKEILPVGGKHLTNAVNWFKENDIELYGVQTNPTQHLWTHSPKAYCDLYIDDAGLGIPTTINPLLSNREYVDWTMVARLLSYKRTI